MPNHSADEPPRSPAKISGISDKLVSRECHPANTLVNLGGIPVGGKRFTIIAGPCAVESPEQMFLTAQAIKDMGAHCLRGGAYKPRSSPYSFQGLGRSRKPVILKRGMSATVEDLLLAAEYVVSEGNPQVILCERGIRTFETATRNTLDLNAIPYIKQHSHLPVIVDPSHGTGVREFVGPMSKAAAACGADGLLVEVHHNPKVALSDGHQSLDPAQFSRFMDELRPFVEAAGREL